MDLVDVHAHLELVEDLDGTLKRASAVGVKAVIAQGVNHETNQKVLELAEKHDIVQAALGMYPSEMHSVELKEGHERTTAYSEETTLKFIENHAKDIVAIGEVGMDLKESDDLEAQKKIFRDVVRLAKKIRKPIIVHSRKAETEILDILDEEDYRRVVMHCFMGKRAVLERAVRMGLYFSIPAAVVRIKQFQENVDVIPVGQLLTETDAPYLGVERDLPSEPAQVRDAMKVMAEIKRMDTKEMANQIWFNYQKLFQ